MSRRRHTCKLRKIQNRRRNRAARERAARLVEAALREHSDLRPIATFIDGIHTRDVF